MKKRTSSKTLLKIPTGQTKSFQGDVVATSKKKLLNGSFLDGEGGSTVWGKLIPAEKSLKLNALPIGLANKLKLKNDIVEGNIITWQDVEFNINDETISYRKKMENQIKY